MSSNAPVPTPKSTPAKRSSESSVSLPRTAVPIGITDPVEQARVELKAALAAIEVKGNLPRRAAQASDRFQVKARAFSRSKPTAAVAAVVAVSATVGALVWTAVKTYLR